ncbi:MAG TPA: hypothetical protein VIX59_16985 [Candidatus Binataceae bacterium]
MIRLRTNTIFFTVAVFALIVVAPGSSILHAQGPLPPSAAGSPTAAKPAAPSATPKPAPKLTQGQQQFVDQFLKAVNARDRKGLTELVAPKALACFNQDNDAYLKRWLEKQANFQVQTTYQARFLPLDASSFRNSPYMTFPVLPTHTMEIEFTGVKNLDITMIRMVTLDNSKWYLAAPCPTAAGLARFNLREKKRAYHRDQAEQIYAKLQDPLLTQLRTLIKQGQPNEAIKVCAKSLQIKDDMAHDVVLLLMGRHLN